MGVLVGLQKSDDLIGRHSALVFWDGLLTRPAGARGAVVDLAGEPGTGKSRMLAEFAHRARRRGFPVETDCSEGQPQNGAEQRPRVVLLDDVGRTGGTSVRDAIRMLAAGPPEGRSSWSPDGLGRPNRG